MNLCRNTGLRILIGTCGDIRATLIKNGKGFMDRKRVAAGYFALTSYLPKEHNIWGCWRDYRKQSVEDASIFDKEIG